MIDGSYHTHNDTSNRFKPTGAIDSFHSVSVSDSLLAVSSTILRENHSIDSPPNTRLGTYKTIAQTPINVQNEKQGREITQNETPSFYDRLDDLQRISLGFGRDTYEYELCHHFLTYLRDKSTSHIIAHGKTPEGEDVEHDFGYPHRYTDKYVRGRFAKMYKLDEWYQKHKHLKMTFVTLTTHHNIAAMESLNMGLLACRVDAVFKRLQEGKHLLFREMLRRHPGMQYVCVVEPHESGIPHIHAIIFESFSIDEQIEYRKMWERWNMGSFEHGLDFDERKDYKINSIRNYLLSYMLKSLPGYKSKFKGTAMWTKEEILFNATAHKHGYRTWCPSHQLTMIMRYKYTSEKEINWSKTMLKTDLDEFELWNVESPAARYRNPHKEGAPAALHNKLPATEPDGFSLLWELSVKLSRGLDVYTGVPVTIDPPAKRKPWEQMRVLGAPK
jgi:hypothetical protein